MSRHPLLNIAEWRKGCGNAVKVFGAHPVDCGECTEALIAAIEKWFLEDQSAPACEHDWVDMRNSRIESGEWCSKCNAIRAGNQSAPTSKCEKCDGTGHDLGGTLNPTVGAADCLACGGRGTAAKGDIE